MAAEPYAALAARLGGALTRRWRLTGGVSADVQALELARPDGTSRTVVVRRHGATDWKEAEAGVVGIERGVMSALADAGLPVPRPLLRSEPFLVLPFVEGSTDAAPAAALAPMADFLARLHALDVEALELPAMPRRDDPMPELLRYLPERLSHLAPRLQARPAGPARASLLHGDYWPGNVIWREGRIAAVIDWEDTALGDPLADVAGCRVELLWRYGQGAPEGFTACYQEASGAAIDRRALARWELYVCSAGLAFMDRWGLAPEVEATMRARSQPFLDRAAEVIRRG